MADIHVLVTDDDPLVCKGLKFNLEQSGYRVSTAGTAHSALELASRNVFDAAILDIGLPDENGLDLCQNLKARQNLPILFLTARRRELDEVIGLEVGADDYITKPFNVNVVLARLGAVLRRLSKPTSEHLLATQPITAGSFELNPVTHTVRKNNVPLNLAPREYELLRLFISHPDRAFTNDELVEGIWGVEFTGEPQVLHAQLRRLRRKVEEEPAHPRHVLTVPGVGYKFAP